ncbi:MAG: DNA polymerase III subunit delta [Patescibacteria group bacterium]
MSKPHIYLFCGDDTYSIAERVAFWKREFCAKYGKENCFTLDCEEADGSQSWEMRLRGHLHSSSLFSATALVILKNAFSKSTKKITTEAILKELDSIPLTHFVVFQESSVDQRTALSKKLVDLERTGIAAREIFTAPTGSELVSWIEKQVSRHGGSMDRAAVRSFASLMEVGSAASPFSEKKADLWRASTELHKLASFAQGRAIVADDVELLVSRQDESHVFSFIDTLLAGDGATARRMTAHLLAQKDSSAVGIIVLLQNQFRAFCILKDLCATGTSDADAAAKLSWNPKRVWVVKKKLQRIPLERLLETYRFLIASDYRLKKGISHSVLELERLIQLTAASY